jgi:hypothetical protein
MHCLGTYFLYASNFLILHLKEEKKSTSFLSGSHLQDTHTLVTPLSLTFPSPDLSSFPWRHSPLCPDVAPTRLAAMADSHSPRLLWHTPSWRRMISLAPTASLRRQFFPAPTASAGRLTRGRSRRGITIGAPLPLCPLPPLPPAFSFL